MQHKPFETTLPILMMTFFATLAILPAAVPAEDGPAEDTPAEDGPWHLRAALVSMNPSSGSVRVDTGEQFSYSSGSGIGIAIGMEYHATRRLGIDFGLIASTPGIDTTVGVQPLTVSASADIGVVPIYAALNIHLTPDHRFDVYLGPMLAYVIYQQFDLFALPGLSERFSTQNDLGIGAVLGLDIGLGSNPGSGNWSLNAAIRYLETTLEARPADGDVGKTDFDPTIFSFGFGYRF